MLLIAHIAGFGISGACGRIRLVDMVDILRKFLILHAVH